MTTTDIQFNLDMMKFMGATVKLGTDPTEYRVFGLDWATDRLLIFDHAPVHYLEATIVSEDYEED